MTSNSLKKFHNDDTKKGFTMMVLKHFEKASAMIIPKKVSQ